MQSFAQVAGSSQIADFLKRLEDLENELKTSRAEQKREFVESKLKSDTVTTEVRKQRKYMTLYLSYGLITVR